MEAVRQWALSLCFAAVAGAVSHMLLPEGDLQKMYRVTFSVFFLSCLFSPVLTDVDMVFFSEAEIPETVAAEQLESRMEKQIADDFARSLETLAEETAKKAGIKGSKAMADINITEDGGILINRLRMTIPQVESEKELELTQAIEWELGVAPEVEIAGE